MDPTLFFRRVGQTLRTASRPSARSTFSRAKSTASGNAAPLPDAGKTNITWPEYLAIRKGKRRWETAFTIPCAIAGFVGGVAYFGTQETDATKPIMGIDPLFFYGGCTIMCAGAGVLVGPLLGNSAWRLTHRARVIQIDAREREFYQHIVKRRVNPVGASARNFVPDYYGEKIGSIPQYRQWLRDQAKFRRKATLPEE